MKKKELTKDEEQLVSTVVDKMVNDDSKDLIELMQECKISNNTVYLDRNNVDSWIENMSKMKRNEDLKLNDDFNINVQAKKFEKLLSKIVNE